jgi:NAD-dependent SIR2 family protein deacetylase
MRSLNRYEDMANPRQFATNPRLAWGFYLTRMKQCVAF